MKKNNFYIALGALAAVPLLLLLQQFLMPRQTPRPPRPLRIYDGKLRIATEEGLEYGRTRAKHIAYAAAVYAARESTKRLKTGSVWGRRNSVILP